METDMVRDLADKKWLQRMQPLRLSRYEKIGLVSAMLASGATGYLATNDGLGAIVGAAVPGTAYLLKKALF